MVVVVCCFLLVVVERRRCLLLVVGRCLLLCVRERWLWRIVSCLTLHVVRCECLFLLMVCG